MKKGNLTIPIQSALEEEVSVFETMRSYSGTIIGFDEHIERIQESAKTIGLPFKLKAAELKSQIKMELKNFGGRNAVIRPTVFKSGIKFFISKPRLIDPKFYEKGVEVATSAARLSPVNAAPVGAKSNFYGPQALSYLTHLRNYFEIMYLDSDGFVGELQINNIFLIKNNILKTPPAVHILNGVTRRLVLNLAEQVPIEVMETPLTRHDFYNADECFLTNSIVEIMPVIKIDGRLIGSGKPGQLTKRLRKHYQEVIQRSSV